MVYEVISSRCTHCPAQLLRAKFVSFTDPRYTTMLFCTCSSSKSQYILQ